MFGQKFFPYSTLQELNLDWILTKVKNILRFVPDDGVVGQILRRTPDGAEWSNETGGGGAVNSVNGQTGDVVLDASDVGALPDSYTGVTSIVADNAGGVPTSNTGNVSMVGSGCLVLTTSPNRITVAVNHPVTSVNTKTGAVVLDKTDIGLGNVSNVAQYSASNPPPYPVTSVNTKTGAVVLDKTDIGLGNVSNVAQYSASNPPPYPVTSVNGQTGDVVIPASGLIIDTTTIVSSVNLAANTATDYSASIAKTGYTPLGIVGVYKSGSSYAYVSISRFYIDYETEEAHVAVYNTTSTQRTVTIQVTVLYTPE